MGRLAGGLAGAEFGATAGVLAGGAALSAGLSGALSLAIPVIGTIVGALIGSKVFKTSVGIQGQGIQAGPQSLASIRNQGFQGQTYADVETKKRVFGIAYSTRQSTVTGALDADLSRTFTQIFSNAGDALISASSILNKDLSVITGKVDSFVVNLGKLNLQGLNTEDQQKLFENVVGAELDRLVTEVYPEILAFIKVGEGAGTTLARMTYGIESANMALQILGIQAIKYTDILNKQGDVGGEIVRQSILAVETQDLIKRVIENADGTAQDIVDLYTQLDTLRDTLVNLGVSQNFLNERVLIAAGGTEAFSDSISKFYDKFISEGVKTSIETAKATAAFTSLGVAVPKTREEFVTLFQSLTTRAPESAAALLKVIDSIDTLYTVSEGADKVGQEREGLQRKFDELTMSTSAFTKKWQEVDITKIDVTNRALQRQIWAQENLNTVAKTYASRLEDTTKMLKSQITTLTDYKSALLSSDKTTLTTTEQYARAKGDLDTLQAIISKTAVTPEEVEARNTAISRLTSATDKFLGLSRQLYASGAQYNVDFNSVMGIIDNVNTGLDTQLTDAQRQLEEVKTSNTFLQSIDASSKSTATLLDEYLTAQGSLAIANAAATAAAATAATTTTTATTTANNAAASAAAGTAIQGTLSTDSGVYVMAPPEVQRAVAEQWQKYFSEQASLKTEIQSLNQNIAELQQVVADGAALGAAATDRNTEAIVDALDEGNTFNRFSIKAAVK
jgi:type IV secretory pathway protease TraF